MRPTTTVHLDVYYWNVKFSRILNRFCAVLNGPETIMSRLDQLDEIDTALLRWRDEIPMEYRPEQENQAPHHVYHFVAFLHLEYFNLLRAIHWSSLISVQANRDTAAKHRSPRIRASEGICLAAARSFITTLNV